jgi:Ala-tRNA(Pro) deacylase
VIAPSSELVAALLALGIEPEIHRHPPVMTVAESLVLVPQLPGCRTKNLFLRDARRRRRFLVTVAHGALVDLRALRVPLAVKGLSFASPDELMACLGVSPGAVSLLALVNDRSRSVEFVVDRQVWSAEAVQAHPLDNAATAVLTHAMLERFLAATGHAPAILDFPPIGPAHEG